MNLTSEELERALTALAARADLAPAPDRVASVHRRHRRSRAVRTGVAGGVAAAIAAVVVGLGPGQLLGLHRDARTPAQVTPTPTSTTAHLTVGLSRDDVSASAIQARPGATTVVVKAALSGLVPRPPGAPAGPDTTGSLAGMQVDWGDGGVDRAAAYPGCVPDAALVPVQAGTLLTHYYTRAGTYTVTYTATACAPVGKVVATLVVTVAAPTS